MLTLNPESWKFMIASEMEMSNCKTICSTLKGPVRRSVKLSRLSATKNDRLKKLINLTVPNRQLIEDDPIANGNSAMKLGPIHILNKINTLLDSIWP